MPQLGRLTIVGGGREAWPARRRGSGETLWARGASPARSSGPSTSPLGRKRRSPVRNRIFGAIGVLWGGAMLTRAYFGGGPEGTGAYRNGQITAVVFAALLVLIGGYYLIKGNGRAKS